MKKIIIMLIMLIATSAYADRWCQWSGTEGENCKNDSAGVLNLPFPTRTESIINSKGYYRVTITQPTIGTDEVKDTMIWDKVDNQISLTWSVRSMTAAEIDARDAEPMDIDIYRLWKVLLITGVITQQQAVDRLPAEMIDAYQARDRIENP